MVVNIETAIAWMRARQGQVSYSMDDRNGPDSYDCSFDLLRFDERWSRVRWMGGQYRV